MKDDYSGINTLFLHAAGDQDPATGALSTPIYQVSTFHRDADNPSDYEYSRSANPTRDVLEEYIAKVEGGIRGYAFSSGMAAISTILFIFFPGDHILAGKDIYGGSYRILTQVFKQWQLEVDFVDITDIETVKKAVKPNTKAIFFEIVSNPFQKIADLKSILAICREKGLLSIIDNTFLPPYYCRPLELGADIVLHSATKFLNGHSDVVAGVAAAKDPVLAKKIGFMQNAVGAVLGPQDSWLLLRGLKTLGVRMERQEKSAQKIAPWLLEQSWVKKVYYPGLPGHPGKTLLENISTGYGAIITFEVTTSAVKNNLMQKLSLPAVAVSLGAVESILTHPATMSHASMPKAVREELGICDNLFRLSVGLEDPEDLVKDFLTAVES
ncbi:MAG: PLP-dependent transferase [Peptococcaceae bacterium]|nr:PLP-dependent transferase [Peptococcaceae bacterium]